MQTETTHPTLTFTGDIPFSQNWNGKLFCKYLTTIRLYNTAFYHVGSYYRLMLKKDWVLNVKIVGLRYCKIHDLPEYTCYQDTGYNKEQTTAMLQKMYAGKNWDTQLLAIVLLENLDYEKILDELILNRKP